MTFRSSDLQQFIAHAYAAVHELIGTDWDQRAFVAGLMVRQWTDGLMGEA